VRKRTGDKERAILDAAVRVFAEQGYHGAQMARIAELAGVANGTLYLYFRNKKDLLGSLFRTRLGALIERRLADEARGGEPLARLRALVADHLGTLGDDVAFATVTQVELRQVDPEMRRAISDVMRGYFAILDRIIADAQAAALIRRDLDPRLVRNVVYGTLDQLATAWVLSGARTELAALAGPTTDALLGGLAAGTGAAGGTGAADAPREPGPAPGAERRRSVPVPNAAEEASA
jgi:TetR/AcrR family fatty acid metabolism transcriptional regulator